MRHFLSAIVAAFEAAAIALVSLSMVLIPAVILWIFPLSLNVSFLTIVEAVSKIWGLGHGIPMTITISGAEAAFIGVPTGYSFLVTLKPLGLTLISIFLAARLGSRAAIKPFGGSLIVLVASMGFAVMSFLILWAAQGFATAPGLKIVFVASLWFAVPAFFTIGVLNFRHVEKVSMHRLLDTFIKRTIPRASRLAAAVIFSLILLAALLFAVRLAATYSEAMRLTQALQLDLLGNLLVTFSEIVFLPVFFIWIISWMSGVGFSLGAGSIISPFENLVGPIPGYPIFAAIPQKVGDTGAIFVALVLLLFILIGLIFGGLSEYSNPDMKNTIGVILLAAIITGIGLVFLGLFSSGAIGPGRLQHVGVDSLMLAAVITLESFIGLSIGIFLRRLFRLTGAKETVLTVTASGNESRKTEDSNEIMRVADPQESLQKPWFKKSQTDRKTPEPTFDEDELIQEFSWESIVEEE